ncbi:Mur ligase family protein [Candidatus Vampirococcus lugosii]|uniref:UDP-N-acetylmuramoylalanine-D-glutamate ligase (MurD) n=1 Tax=Candidatus Vampirococcus lugosii TaxID=2789015 RepID=A0ABS5QMK9_9BACT|nr:Mur ligase family protein [Candidatus Vampirococcus lugosii]MBS8122440.1 UDP-N-acetylmuramoylalanine-D-glutamate ligase (MurD) [Candidatus Vampirococcus lugosii]
MYIIYGKGEVGQGLKKLFNFLNIKNIICDDRDFLDIEINDDDKIILSPGIKPSHFIYKFHKNKIISELDMIYKILKKYNLNNKFNFIGITGTKGKSTTSWILYNILKQKYDNIYLGGNFSPSLSEVLYNIFSNGKKNEVNTIIVELSSFMLYNTDYFDFQNSIFTNIETDHLDRHIDFQDYFASKQKIFKFTKNKVYIGNNLSSNLSNNLIKIDKYEFFETNLLGEHNQKNINFVYKICKNHYQINKNEFQNYLYNINSLPNTLEFVKEIKGVSIYNDGKSTTPGALRSALESFDKKLVLIAGGYDKGANFDELGEIFVSKISFVCLIGNTAPKIANIMKNYNIDYQIYNSLQDASENAINEAIKRNIDIVLFSPGCSSFDMFDNYKHRAKVFLNSIKKNNE